MSSLQHKNSFSVLAGLLLIALIAGGCGGEEAGKGQGDACLGCLPDAGPDAAVTGCRSNNECNDDINCTEDTCHNGDCQSIPDNTKCQAGETCEPDRGGCFKAKSCFNDEQCDDGLDCTVEGCNTQTKLCETIYDDARCSAGSVCLPEHPWADYESGCARGKRCTSVADCRSEFACVTGECYFKLCKMVPNDVACDDNINCTQDSCQLDVGCLNTPDNYSCDDNNFCNGEETCDVQQGCQPGLIPTCDDQISCTADSCDPGYGCQHEANDALCDDHDVCNGTEYCDSHSDCQPGRWPLDCNDYIDCTVDSCDPVEGCQHQASDALCDDQIACTVDSCRVDFGGCIYEPSDALCDDDNVCTGREYCDPYDDCQPGTPLTCDDHVACTVDSCQPELGCIHEPNDALCDDDQIDCTVASCQPDLGCVHQPNDAFCNDQISCTTDSCNVNFGCQYQINCGVGQLCDRQGQCQSSLTLGCSNTQGLQPNSPWPMFGYCPTHQHRSPFVGPQENTEKWRFTTGSSGSSVTSSPAIGADGTIYVGAYVYDYDEGYYGKLYAINPDGTQKWAVSVGYSRVIDSSPAIGVDGTIYVGSYYIDAWAGIYTGSLYAVNPDGTQKWQFGSNIYSSSPAIGADGTIYVGSEDSGYHGNLYAINPDGTQKWVFWTGYGVSSMGGSSPAIGVDGTIYVGAFVYEYGGNHGKLYAINPDGSQRWAFPTSNPVNSSPAIGADGTIYIGVYGEAFYAINPDGTQKWRSSRGGAYSPAIDEDGTIYVGDGHHDLLAINLDGTLKWRFDTGGGVSSSLAIGADDTIYVGSDVGNLYAVNPDGTEKWRFGIGSSTNSPAIGADGTIYVGSSDGNLYAIGP